MASTNALAPIPHPPKKPVVGNMLSLDSHAPVQDLVRLSKELGPIFWLDMMGAPLVIVAGHDLVEEVSDEKRFDKAVRGALRRVRAVGGDGLFTADTKEPNWSKAHNILMQPFGNRAMQSYHPSMVDIAEQLVKKWERLNGDEEIDVVHDMTALTLDTIGLCGFDYRFNSFYRKDYHPFVESLVRSLETIMMTRGLPLENLWMKKRRTEMAGDVAFMNQMVDEIIAERRKAAGSADEPSAKKDMLAAMMTGVDRATGEQLDDVNIRYQINTFLIAGHETTSGLLSCAIYALLKHPEVLKKAYEEVDRVLGPDTDIRPTYQQVTQLHYITQILKEALRLWPPAPAYGVAPISDETIGGKYKLKKGTFVTVLVLALHRDPSVWGPNPDAFDPENFSKEAEAKRPLNAWKPFGNGQRACIGRGFAMHEAALALGMILQRFKLYDHQRYQMVLKETLTIKPDGFKIKVKPRTDHDHAAFTGAAAATAAKAAAAPARARPGHNTPLLVLYGSNLGSAEELATRVADLAEVNGFATKLAPLDDYAGKLPKEGGVLIFCASYNGAPPDNAAQFVKWLGTDMPKDALKGVNYAVFGCGNSDWLATYQSIPRLIDEQLAAHGATSAYPRGEGDAREDLDGQFDAWFAKMAPVTMKALGVDGNFARSADDAPLYTVTPVAPGGVTTIAGQGGVMPMKVLENRELQNHAGDNKRSTRHIEVQLPAGVSYRVGDHLSVVPRNDPALVDAVARRFGFQSADQIRLAVAEGRRAQLPSGDAVSVGRLLSDFVELQQIATRKQIQIMAEHTRCPVTKPKLLAYVGDDAAASERYRADVLGKRKSVYNLLEEFPACELPFHVYLEMLSLLAPRYYSISSSPQGDAARCSITTAVVEGAAASGRGIYRGVCSNYLGGRRAGETIHAVVRETKAGFRLPDDPLRPIIMIGPGTGLAPFRGFLQERAALKKAGATLGPAMLFFGCRNPDQDFLYRSELEQFAADGVADLHVAFSRGDGPKTYVQHQIGQQKDRVWPLIEQGAVIFVCGDGGKMEPDVKAALVSIYREKTGADAAAGARWIDDMGTSQRYVLDVWAGS